jgi:hypothetical protein
MNATALCLPATSAPALPARLASSCLKAATTPVVKPSKRNYTPDPICDCTPEARLRAPKTQHRPGFLAGLAADHRSLEADHVGTTTPGNP